MRLVIALSAWPRSKTAGFAGVYSGGMLKMAFKISIPRTTSLTTGLSHLNWFDVSQLARSDPFSLWEKVPDRADEGAQGGTYLAIWGFMGF